MYLGKRKGLSVYISIFKARIHLQRDMLNGIQHLLSRRPQIGTLQTREGAREQDESRKKDPREKPRECVVDHVDFVLCEQHVDVLRLHLAWGPVEEVRPAGGGLFNGRNLFWLSIFVRRCGCYLVLFGFCCQCFRARFIERLGRRRFSFGFCCQCFRARFIERFRFCR